MSEAVLGVPTQTVVPSGVRRRLGARDALLVAVLAAEVMSGVGARALWDNRAALGDVLVPAPAIAAVGTPVESTTTWVVVPPAPTPAAVPPPPLRTDPRNPFAVQVP